MAEIVCFARKVDNQWYGKIRFNHGEVFSPNFEYKVDLIDWLKKTKEKIYNDIFNSEWEVIDI